MKKFKCSLEVYNNICKELDIIYNLPNPETKTLRVLPPANKWENDDQENVYFVLPNDLLDNISVLELINNNIQQNQLQEILEINL